MLINAIDPEESRIAVVEDGVLQELHVELANREAYLGNIYKGKVVNIEPSIGAAFVAFGGRVNGFLHVSDVLPAYGRPDFVLDDVIEGRARVDVDDSPESMQQALVDDEEDDSAPPSGAEGAVAEPAAVEESNVTVADGEAEDHEPVDPRDEEPSGEEPMDPNDADAGLPPHDDRERPEGGFGTGILERPLEMAASGIPGGEGPGDAAPGDDGGDEPAASAGAADATMPSTDEGPGPAGEGRSGPGQQRRRNRRGGRGGGGGGGGGGHGERRPRGPRPTIDQLLKKGQEVVVQITKEGIGSKGPTLTTYVSLPGRCLVLMPSLPKCGVSRKIEDGRERKRLKRIVRELDETGSGGIGFIVRTAGVNKSLQDLQRDRDYLKKIWELVAQRL
jgi:ribonuclease E